MGYTILYDTIITIKHVLFDALTSAGPLGRIENLAFQVRVDKVIRLYVCSINVIYNFSM